MEHYSDSVRMEQRSEAVTVAKANSDNEELKALISTLKDESKARHQALVEALTEERKWKRETFRILRYSILS